MYVANSEPAIWCWGGGRAGVIGRGLISGEPNRHEAGRDTGRWCVLPREALLLCRRRVPQTIENRLEEANPKRGGTEGGRFTGRTDDAGPMKPGNSVEDKTLPIRRGARRAEAHSAQPHRSWTWAAWERHQAVGDRGREVAVMAPRSRNSAAQEGPVIELG